MADKNEPNERPCCVCSDVAITKDAPAFICDKCLTEFYNLRREAAYKSEFEDSPKKTLSIEESIALAIAPIIKKIYERKAYVALEPLSEEHIELRKMIEVTSYCANCGTPMLPEMKICPKCWNLQWVRDKPSLLPLSPSTHPEFMPPAPAEKSDKSFFLPKCLSCGCPFPTDAEICPRCLGHRSTNIEVRMKADD